MSNIIFRSPSKYIQGKGALESIGEYSKLIGQNPLIISDDIVWGITEEVISKSLKAAGMDYHYVQFNGEASKNEIERISKEGKQHNVDTVIGVGGGKTLDTSKAIADILGVSVIIVPSTASTDAPTSALSVIYNDERSEEHTSELQSRGHLVCRLLLEK